MALILHLETATKTCSVALSEKGNIVSFKEIHSDSFAHGELLTIFINEVLEKARLNIKDLNAISVSSGPGSYTGLRIGISVAKGIAYALNIPLIGISSLESIKFHTQNSNPSNTIIPMIDARRDEVYTLEQNKIISKIIDKDSYNNLENILVVGDANEKIKQIWHNRKDISYIDELKFSAKHQAKLAYQKFIVNDFENLAYFEPNYVKEFGQK